MRVDITGIRKYINRFEGAQLQMEVRKSGEWNALFHLSDNRANVVEWIQVDPSRSALEVGAQAGAVSSVIANKYARYVALDFSDDMREICVDRVKEDGFEYITESVSQYATNHKEEFDDIYMIGVMADASMYTKSDIAQKDIVCSAFEMLKPDGRLIVAAENKLGMKYWAGCQEDTRGGYFVNIENYPFDEGQRSFAKDELEGIIKQGGFDTINWYYPYPDLYFTKAIYSDDYLPKKGDLICNINNYDKDRYLFFDEAKAFDTIIGCGKFPLFSNSFLVIAKKGDEEKNKTIFVKYSKERDEKFAIKTAVVRNKKNGLIVKKSAMYREGERHVNNICAFYNENDERYRKKGIHLNVCQSVGNEIELEYIYGKNLQERLEELILEHRDEEAIRLFGQYVEMFFMNEETSDFEGSEEFQRIFGDIELPQGTQAVHGANIDVICSNIYVNERGWHLIDYEWGIECLIPIKFIMYRTYHLASHQLRECEYFKIDNLMNRYGITQNESKIYEEMERRFQEYVRGENIADYSVHEMIGKKVYTINEINALANKNRVLQEENDRLRREHSTVKEMYYKVIKRLRGLRKDEC